MVVGIMALRCLTLDSAIQHHEAFAIGPFRVVQISAEGPIWARRLFSQLANAICIEHRTVRLDALVAHGFALVSQLRSHLLIGHIGTSYPIF